MFRTKAIKNFQKTRFEIYLWWIQSPISDKIHDLVWTFYSKPVQMIKKIYGWYTNVFKTDYDFDCHCLFAIIEYKLKRVEKCLLNGNSVQEGEDLKALKLAIKLAGRLKDDKYEEKFYVRHDRKWGELKTWFEPVNDGSGNSYWRSSRPNAVTNEQKEEEKSDRRTMYGASENQTKREERWLYAILHKYLRNWWD